jgi:hypothetical protein
MIRITKGQLRGLINETLGDDEFGEYDDEYDDDEDAIAVYETLSNAREQLQKSLAMCASPELHAMASVIEQIVSSVDEALGAMADLVEGEW